MKKITDIFQSKDKTFSFELFPPKTEKGYQKLLETIAGLSKLNPDFISCTYGAGGGNRDKTFDIVELLQEKYNIIGLAHLTCVMNSKQEIRDILDDVKSRNIQNILALRGDPPQDNPDWKPSADNFQYSSDLCAFMRNHYDGYFSVGVAGFPEGHILCKDKQKDAEFLKLKINNGADFVITQLFFDNADYFQYIDRLKSLDINARIIPGILPVTNYQGLLKFSSSCGSSIPAKVKEIFEPIQDDPDAVLDNGIKYAITQCKELLAGGAPGLHFYTLNKISPTDIILKETLR